MTYERITKRWHRAIDHTGKRFGLLTVLYPVRRVSGMRKPPVYWLCQCDCGRQSVVAAGKLMSGVTSSCGCLRRLVPSFTSRKHGHSLGGESTRTFRIWRGMIFRCRDKTNPIYGGRGIKVCDRWQQFAPFLADMGEAPPGMSIERKDVNGNYEPENCCWATTIEQARNRTITIRLTVDGRTMTAVEWAQETGLPYKKIVERHRRGWTDVECLLVTDVAKNGWDTRRKLEEIRKKGNGSP